MLQIFFDSFLLKGPDKGVNVFRISRNNTEPIKGFKYLEMGFGNFQTGFAGQIDQVMRFGRNLPGNRLVLGFQQLFTSEVAHKEDVNIASGRKHMFCGFNIVIGRLDPI